MKKIIFLALIMLPLVSFAQTDTTKSSKPHEQYCLIVATAKMFSSKVSISIDYGQDRGFWSDARLKDDSGKVMTFNSVIDALNYMSSQGWLFVNAYAITMSGNNVLNYIMRKPISAQ